MIEKPLGFCPVTLNPVRALVRLSEGKQPGKVYRIDYLSLRLGMEQLSKFKLIIDRKTAKQNGVDSAVCSLPSRQGNQMIGHSKVQNLY